MGLSVSTWSVGALCAVLGLAGCAGNGPKVVPQTYRAPTASQSSHRVVKDLRETVSCNWDTGVCVSGPTGGLPSDPAPAPGPYDLPQPQCFDVYPAGTLPGDLHQCYTAYAWRS
jgi:hypothetical protein